MLCGGGTRQRQVCPVCVEVEMLGCGRCVLWTCGGGKGDWCVLWLWGKRLECVVAVG